MDYRARALLILLGAALLGCAGGRASSSEDLSAEETEMIEVTLDFARTTRPRDTGNPPLPAYTHAPAVHYQIAPGARRPKGGLSLVHPRRVELDGPSPAWNAGSTSLHIESEQVVVRRLRWTGRADRSLDVVATGPVQGEDLWWHGSFVGDGPHPGSARRVPGPTVRSPQGFSCDRCRLVGATLKEHGRALLTVEGPLATRDLWVLGSTGHLQASGGVELSGPLLVLEAGPLFEGTPRVSVHGGLILVPKEAQAAPLLSHGEVELEGARILPVDPPHVAAALALIEAAWAEGRAPSREEVEAALLP